MKQFATVSFLFATILFSSTVFAQVQYYGINTILNEEGRSFVKLTITFSKPETNFNFNILGKIENFNATSIAGPVSCSLQISGITIINCNLSLTQEKRTVDISFETNDFVRTFENKFYFDGDLSLGKDIGQIFVSIKLPEGMALVSDNITAGKLFPENATKLSDGRRIIVSWTLNEVRSNQNLRFQILYEKIEVSPLFQLRLRHFVVFGVAAAAVGGFLYFYFFRKPGKLVLSVLDDFERKVMDVIVASEGVVNQKKVVKETNLSKAKVSRVVKSLAKRGLVEVERMGRTNRLKLVKKKFKI